MGKYQGWEAPIPGCSNLNTQMPAQLRAAAHQAKVGEHPDKAKETGKRDNAHQKETRKEKLHNNLEPKH